jgi:hypothetical protein
MISRWLEYAAAFLVLWFVLACIAGPFIGAYVRRGGREMPPPPGADEEMRP